MLSMCIHGNFSYYSVVESLTCHSVHKCWAPKRPLPTTALFLSYSWCWSSWLRTSRDPERSSDTPSWIPLCGQTRRFFTLRFRETDKGEQKPVLLEPQADVPSAWPRSAHRPNQTTMSSRWHVPGMCSTNSNNAKTSLEKRKTMLTETSKDQHD